MRVTEKDLQAVVDSINEFTGSPAQPYIKSAAQVGNYHLGGAYGGWKLCKIVNEHGSITDVLNSGYVSKRELYDIMQAFICGLETEVKK